VPKADKNCNRQAAQVDKLEILFPQNGAKFVQHVAQSGEQRFDISRLDIPLSASSSSGDRYWYVNGKHRLTQKGDEITKLSLKKAGNYQIQVFTETAQSEKITIEMVVRETP